MIKIKDLSATFRVQILSEGCCKTISLEDGPPDLLFEQIFDLFPKNTRSKQKTQIRCYSVAHSEIKWSKSFTVYSISLEEAEQTIKDVAT